MLTTFLDRPGLLPPSSWDTAGLCVVIIAVFYLLCRPRTNESEFHSGPDERTQTCSSIGKYTDFI